MISPEREAGIVAAVEQGPKAYETPGDRVRRYLLYAIVVAVVLLAAVLYTVRQTTNANEAALKLFCPAWGDVASAPVPPETKALGIAIVGDARIAYEGAHCDRTTGMKLAPADPRIAAYIIVKAKRQR